MYTPACVYMAGVFTNMMKERSMPMVDRSYPDKTSVNICFTCNQKYIPHCETAIYSLLCNASEERYYDILILHKDINSRWQDRVKQLEMLLPHATIRFVHIKEPYLIKKYKTPGYLSIESTYRLLLLSPDYGQYDRMIYMDSDVIVEGDISDLFDLDLQSNAIGAMECLVSRYDSYLKRALFADNKPYNIDAYKRNVLKLRFPDKYFHSGVILFDLNKARQIADEQRLIEILTTHYYQGGDKETLNIAFNESVYLIEPKWNYLNALELLKNNKDKNVSDMYSDISDEKAIIHYVGVAKPWDTEVVLGEHYNKYRKLCDEYIRTKKN